MLHCLSERNIDTLFLYSSVLELSKPSLSLVGQTLEQPKATHFRTISVVKAARLNAQLLANPRLACEQKQEALNQSKTFAQPFFKIVQTTIFLIFRQ
jgi:hypothetical protein